MIDILFLLPAFAVSSYTDLNKHEIPVWLFPSAAALWILLSFISGSGITFYNIAGVVCTAVPLFLFCLTEKIGGGDLIMFSCVGLILGAENLILYITCLFLSGVVVMLVIKDKKKEIAIAPIAGISYLIYIITKGVVLCTK